MVVPPRDGMTRHGHAIDPVKAHAIRRVQSFAHFLFSARWRKKRDVGLKWGTNGARMGLVEFERNLESRIFWMAMKWDIVRRVASRHWGACRTHCFESNQWFVSLTLFHRIAIYLVDSVFHAPNNRCQGIQSNLLMWQPLASDYLFSTTRFPKYRKFPSQITIFRASSTRPPLVSDHDHF